ncbi:MAG: hypothetical protein A2939_02620 [Parcubacteria group bacterium RIFCSPLOWO2_01_FULL_48_18]|nr:MAG: hypothetical protein A2939_02620 [Parcubacteria group bacterium RIFCSPLOWO2_01_FULL_48_18]OHB22715.1 MAG: hypothetical protein A3J67_01145 [Parcubacteria group bacterium RIFCSPHIGHO2_02_FULL_48_10b]
MSGKVVFLPQDETCIPALIDRPERIKALLISTAHLPTGQQWEDHKPIQPLEEETVFLSRLQNARNITAESLRCFKKPYWLDRIAEPYLSVFAGGFYSFIILSILGRLIPSISLYDTRLGLVCFLASALIGAGVFQYLFRRKRKIDIESTVKQLKFIDAQVHPDTLEAINTRIVRHNEAVKLLWRVAAWTAAKQRSGEEVPLTVSRYIEERSRELEDRRGHLIKNAIAIARISTDITEELNQLPPATDELVQALFSDDLELEQIIKANIEAHAEVDRLLEEKGPFSQMPSQITPS